MVELAAEGRTILISSHGIAEIERVASHAAFLAEGQLLLAGNLDELGQRMLRVRVVQDGMRHDPSGLGTVLDHEVAGKEWQAVVLDPDHTAVEDLKHRPGVLELESAPPKLEEMYTALLARFHRTEGNGVVRGERLSTAMAEEGERR
jgi:ABC-2 type transport system ATP-binding protein